MKRKVAIFASLILGTALISAFPSGNAQTSSDSALRYTPEIDGIIDEAYLESICVEHIWTDHWAVGKYEADDGKDSYHWSTSVKSYFLWDYDEQYNSGDIYVAIDVNDSEVHCIDDEHWQMAYDQRQAELASGAVLNWDPFFQDIVRPHFKYSGNDFELHAVPDGRYACIFKESNFGMSNWIDWYSWSEAEKNYEEGLWAATLKEDGSGYIIELCLPVLNDAARSLLKDGGKFEYQMIIGDASADSGYGLDYALSLEGIEKEGTNLKDIIFLNDKYQKIELSDKTPSSYEESSNDTETPPSPVTDPVTSDSESNNPVTDIPVTDTPVTDTPDINKYDVNGDGEVNAIDLVKLMKNIANEESVNLEGDVNDDGEVNAIDLSRLMNFIAMQD